MIKFNVKIYKKYKKILFSGGAVYKLKNMGYN